MLHYFIKNKICSLVWCWSLARLEVPLPECGESRANFLPLLVVQADPDCASLAREMTGCRVKWQMGGWRGWQRNFNFKFQWKCAGNVEGLDIAAVTLGGRL